MERRGEEVQLRTAAEGITGAARQGRSTRRRAAGLSAVESGSAALILIAWLVLFAGGILIDTKPYRYAISPEGVWAMDGTIDKAAAERYTPPRVVPGRVEAWVVVLFFYLPLNLALICVMAGALGAFGSRANLHNDDGHPDSTDDTSPYASAMLRGFFIYLFLTSGLLLLDDNPFDSPSPGQYIRLAGFLSLTSFVVNYQPHVFSQLIAWAFHRIQARGGEGELRPVDGSVRHTRAATEVVAVHAEVEQIVEATTSSGVIEGRGAGDGLPARGEAAREALRSAPL